MALVAGLVVLVVWGFRVGVCVDSPDPAASGCTSGPAVGGPVAWALTVIAGVVIVHAVRRVVWVVRHTATTAHGGRFTEEPVAREPR